MAFKWFSTQVRNQIYYKGQAYFNISLMRRDSYNFVNNDASRAMHDLDRFFDQASLSLQHAKECHTNVYKSNSPKCV